MKDIYYISLARSKELTSDNEYDLETSFVMDEVPDWNLQLIHIYLILEMFIITREKSLFMKNYWNL